MLPGALNMAKEHLNEARSSALDNLTLAQCFNDPDI